MGSNPNEVPTQEDEITVLVTGFSVCPSPAQVAFLVPMLPPDQLPSMQLYKEILAELANTGSFLAIPSPVSSQSLLGDREVSPAIRPSSDFPDS